MGKSKRWHVMSSNEQVEKHNKQEMRKKYHDICP